MNNNVIDFNEGWVKINGQKIDRTCTEHDLSWDLPLLSRQTCLDGVSRLYSGKCNLQIDKFLFTDIEVLFEPQENGKMMCTHVTLFTRVLAPSERKRFFKISRKYKFHHRKLFSTCFGFPIKRGDCLMLAFDNMPANLSFKWK